MRQRKPQLAELLTREVGKITQESLGEVQEWIDMCDFAVALSRQLHGLTIASERPEHRVRDDDWRWRAQMNYDLRRNLPSEDLSPAMVQFHEWIFGIQPNEDAAALYVAALLALYRLRGD